MIKSPIATDANEVRADLNDVTHVVEDDRSAPFRMIGEIAPSLNRLTAAIHDGWLILPRDVQDSLLDVGRRLDEFLESCKRRRVQQSVFQRLWLALSNDQRNDTFEFSLAVSRFRVELERALATEQAKILAVEDGIASDEQALAELHAGYDENDAGLGTIYTVEELRSRLNTK